MADDIAVMYAGRIVESASAEALFSAPEHPYTWGLLRSIPTLDGPRGAGARADPRRTAEPDQPPLWLPLSSPLPLRPARARAHRSGAAPGAGRADPAGRLPAGQRCAPAAVGAAARRQHPHSPGRSPRPSWSIGSGAASAAVSSASGGSVAPGAGVSTYLYRGPSRTGRGPASEEPLVAVRGLVKHFPITRGIVFQRTIDAVRAVDGVSFDVRRGEALGHRRRDRLRQEHDRAADDAPARARRPARCALTAGHHAR